ncbi:MAG: NAD-dependent protein deacylase [Pirellulales bacterium]|nr:NAD-dependent protein deacylase [Pirellulales bacterium]
MSDDFKPDASIVVLTGAGVSVESGLPSFRGADGLWEGHRLEEVATPEAFARQPQLVQRFYNERRRNLLAANVAPNAAHCALAELERRWPGEFLLVTQNIDDLHQRAGSQRLVPMHGELLKVRCTACGALHEWRDDVAAESACRSCRRADRLRPHVVWFGEMPLELDRIYAALESADLFVSIGTSGHVYPAAGFVAAARQSAGAWTIELNVEPSAVATDFHERRLGPASETVPQLVAELLAVR